MLLLVLWGREDVEETEGKYQDQYISFSTDAAETTYFINKYKDHNDYFWSADTA